MRSSFKKSSQNPKNLTGIPLIDQILGDNERGSMILIKEDEYSRIHNILLNTFVSEGVANNEQDILIIGESDINMVVYELNRTENVESDIKKMFIAWRYSDLKLEQSSYKFSLSSKGSYNGQKTLTHSVSEILSKLKEIKNHRVAIYSLFSPSYAESELEKWLFEIRKVVRENGHICMISLPTFLYENVHFELFFDNVFLLKSNLLTGLLPNYRATIEIEKISAYKNIRQINLESFIFGIKFMKDKLIVENIDIPPDESENTINCTAF